MKRKYIIQLWNNKHFYWFDYITFYNKINASRFYDRFKKCSNNKIHVRLIEVAQYDFKEY